MSRDHDTDRLTPKPGGVDFKPSIYTDVISQLASALGMETGKEFHVNQGAYIENKELSTFIDLNSSDCQTVGNRTIGSTGTESLAISTAAMSRLVSDEFATNNQGAEMNTEVAARVMSDQLCLFASKERIHHRQNGTKRQFGGIRRITLGGTHRRLIVDWKNPDTVSGDIKSYIDSNAEKLKAIEAAVVVASLIQARVPKTEPVDAVGYEGVAMVSEAKLTLSDEQPPRIQIYGFTPPESGSLEKYRNILQQAGAKPEDCKDADGDDALRFAVPENLEAFFKALEKDLPLRNPAVHNHAAGETVIMQAGDLREALKTRKPQPEPHGDTEMLNPAAPEGPKAACEVKAIDDPSCGNSFWNSFRMPGS